MQVFARYSLARRYGDPHRQALLLEGSWPQELEAAGRWSLDDEIDARHAWIDALAVQFAERLAEGGAEALAEQAAEDTMFPPASLAYLNALKLRYYLVRLLRIVVFCRELHGLDRGEPCELFVERGRDEDYTRLFTAVCRVSGNPLRVCCTSTVAGESPHRVSNASWRRLAAAAQRWTVSSAAKVSTGDERVLLCGNPRLLDPLCAKLLDRGCAVRWLNDRFAFGIWRRRRRRGVAQLVLNSDRGRTNRFSPADSLPRMEYLGVDLVPTLAYWLNTCRRIQGAPQTRIVEQVQRHNAHFRPSRIVVDEDATPLPRAALAVAHAAGAVSTVVQHGAPCVRFGFAPLAADRIAVWGDTTGRQLRRWSVPEKKIHVTGSSYHDQLRLRASEQSQRRRESGGPRILMAATVPAEDARPDAVEYHLTRRTEVEMLRAVMTAVSRLRGAKLTIRLHPRARDGRTLSNILAEFPGIDVRISRGDDLVQALLASDCVISCASGTGVDAVLLSVPVIGLMPAGSRELLPHDEWGFHGTAHSDGELERALNDVLCHGGTHPDFDPNAVSHRGKTPAAERIADVVLSPFDRANGGRTSGSGKFSIEPRVAQTAHREIGEVVSRSL